MSKNGVVLLLSYCTGFQLKRLMYLADVSPVSTPEQRNKIETTGDKGFIRGIYRLAPIFLPS